MTRPAPVSRERLRAALASAGAAPRKRHGQHFLLDDNLLDAIVRHAGELDGRRVLEVGPGPGLLTRHLLSAGASVVAVEIDHAMEQVAGALIEPDLATGLEWIEADALAGSRRLGEATDAALGRVDAFISNLPYGIAGPLLGAVACHPSPPGTQVVLIQKEMGERLVAAPGTRDYGPLAVLMALAAQVRVLRAVPPAAFWPPPKVDSVVVSLSPRPERPDPGELSGLSSFLALAFHNRRKTLWNSVRQACGDSVASALDPDAIPESWKKVRAEALDPVQLYDLAQTWAGIAPGERHRPEAGNRPPS
jgi:16S rRNA (adenine1518-N6/adenine1519-N6)-dimethyltransferase